MMESELEAERGADEMQTEQEKIDEGVARYIAQMPLPETLEQAIDERDSWIESACQFSRNEDYYRGLVDQIGALFGAEAYTADDGSVSDEILRAKVPELVAALAIRAPSLPERLRELSERATRRPWENNLSGTDVYRSTEAIAHVAGEGFENPRRLANAALIVEAVNWVRETLAGDGK